MQRASFIKSLVGLPAIGLLNFESIKQYEKVFLKQFFVRGFSYYAGPEIIDEINKSGQLELVREPKNKYDKRAIALHFNKQKLATCPRESNKTISILMDTELLEFHAEITHIEPEASNWEKIRVAVYALKEIKHSDDLKKIEPYAELYTPTYYSLRSENDTLTRIEHFDPLEDDELDDSVTILTHKNPCPEDLSNDPSVDSSFTDLDDEEDDIDDEMNDDIYEDDEMNDDGVPINHTVEVEILYVDGERIPEEKVFDVDDAIETYLEKKWEEI